ncbi:MAG: hypothetical protein LBU51_03510 [Bacteroidales bacterium]|jgi:hypothetical protein|nr:hypothetical protein [Bacteroidales bacterium]
MKFGKWTKIFVLIAIMAAFIAFIVIIPLTNTMSGADLKDNFVGNMLGAIITAIVTVLLLNGQTSAEEVKERNVAVFDKKSKIFQRYMKKLWKVLDNNIVSNEEYYDLANTYITELVLYLPIGKMTKNNIIENSNIDYTKEKNMPWLDKKSWAKHTASEKIEKCLKVIKANRVQGDENLTDEKEIKEKSCIFRSSIVEIINALGNEINLGGGVSINTMDALLDNIGGVKQNNSAGSAVGDTPSLPGQNNQSEKFKDILKQKLNEEVKSRYKEVLKEAENWQLLSKGQIGWDLNEDKYCLDFEFKDYPMIKLRCWPDEKGFHVSLFVPWYAYGLWHPLRDSRTPKYPARYRVRLWENDENLLEKQDPWFDFTKGDDGFKNMPPDLSLFASQIAKRFSDFIQNTKCNKPNFVNVYGKDLTIPAALKAIEDKAKPDPKEMRFWEKK